MHRLRAALDRLFVRVTRIVHPERDVMDAVAMSPHVLRDVAVGPERGGEHEADLLLNEQVAGAAAHARFRALVAGQLIAERALIIVRRLLRVSDVELDVVRTVDRKGIMRLGADRCRLRSHALPPGITAFEMVEGTISAVKP